MDVKKIIIGFATAATLGGGGTIVVDQQINPYEDKGNRFEIVASSTIEEAGKNKVSLEKDRPAVTLEKWNGEAGLTVAYEKVKGKGNRAFLTDRMEWKDGKEEVHAYPLDAKEGMEDGGFEIEVILNEKPDTNVFDFKIEGAEELDFFYQPDLTPEEIEEGFQRPESAVRSYAVYHKERANYRLGQTNYDTGKAFHIYRPKAIDAGGNEQWAELSYADGTLTVTVPETWLANATYPVSVDPTFGYTTQGASTYEFVATTVDNPVGLLATLPTLAVPTSISYYARHTINPKSIFGRIYAGSAGSRGTSLYTSVAADNASTSYTLETRAITARSLTATTYWLEAAGSPEGPGTGVADIAYDTGGATDTGYTTDDVGVLTYNTNKYSIYATYCDPSLGYCIESYTVAGAFAWTAPTSVTSADVACWGAGGGGGVIASSGGGGGGGGAFASSTVGVTAGTSYTVRVGAGGAEDSSTPAGDSSFGTTTVVADGGVGTIDETAGTGGTVANSTGDVEFAGGTPGVGKVTGDVGGGGGGGAGPSGKGGNGASGTSYTVGGGGGGGNGGSDGSGATGGASTNGGAGGNGGNAAVGLAGASNSKGGGGGGGGDNTFRGGAAGVPGGGSGGGEVTGAGAGAAGQCTITYTIASGDTNTPVPDIIFNADVIFDADIILN